MTKLDYYYFLYKCLKNDPFCTEIYSNNIVRKGQLYQLQ